MDKLNLFFRLAKADAKERVIYGVAAAEEPDAAREIMDYASSKPNFEKWSEEFAKATDGKSLGNVRAMHSSIAAGRLEQISFNDEGKQIEVAAKIVDDNEWKKVEEGVYTGFSIGGAYQKRWKDGELTRYTAKPSELSLVDSPCIKSARYTMIKMDGSQEERMLKSVEGTEEVELSNDEVAEQARVLAKADGDEKRWASFIPAAREALLKAKAKDPAPAKDESNQEEETPPKKGKGKKTDKEGEAEADAKKEEDEDAKGAANDKKAKKSDESADPELEQVWKAKDGQTFSTKKEAAAHNEELKKAEDAPESVKALRAALAAKPKEEPVAKGESGPETDTANQPKKASGPLYPTDGDLPEALMALPAQARAIFREAANAAAAHGALDGLSVMDEAWGKVREGWAQDIDGSWKVRTTGEGPMATKSDEPYWLTKKEFSTDRRKELADSGKALPDGSYPIESKSDLKNAVHAFGRSKPGDRAKVKAHIKSRAKALGAEDMIPDEWKKIHTEGNLKKGLDGVGRLACLIQELEWLQCSQEWEEEMERDMQSTLPADLKEAVVKLCGILRNMVAEETSELLDSEESMAYGDMLARFERTAGVEALTKTLKADDLAQPLLAKVGAAANTGVGMSKKDLDELLELRKMVPEVIERLKKLEDQPEPPKAPGGAAASLHVVDKGDDAVHAAQTKLDDIAKNDPEAMATALIKLAQRLPKKVDGIYNGRQ